MTFDLVEIASFKIRIRSLILLGPLAAYVAVTFALFFWWIGPTLDGHSGQHIAADSSTYLYFAESLRSGKPNPLVVVALSSFPNTLWSPVLLAFVLKNTFAIVIADYAMFFLSLVLLRKSVRFELWIFLGLFLLNATTTISLLSVNKEIFDLLAVSMFLFATSRRHYGTLFLALLLALFNRFEVGLVMLLYLAANSRFNPMRKRRVLTLVALIVCLSVSLPLAASKSLDTRYEEAHSGGAVAWLDSLEIHYMYGVAVIPKVAENLFGEMVNADKWRTYDTSDIANSYILLSNNLATALVFVVLIARRKLTMQSDLIYLAALGSVIMAVSLVIQPRYFYFVYLLLCLQAASVTDNGHEWDGSFQLKDAMDREPLYPRQKEITVG